MIFTEYLQKLSFIVGVPVSTLLIFPLVLALSIQAIRSSDHRASIPVFARNNQERAYLNERNKFAGVLSIALLIVTSYVSFTVFQTRSLPRVNVDQINMEQLAIEKLNLKNSH